MDFILDILVEPIKRFSALHQDKPVTYDGTASV